MIIECARSIIPIVVLLFIGGSIYQVVYAGRRNHFLDLLGFGWGLGIVALYVVGLIFVNFGLSLFYLPYILIPIALILTVLAFKRARQITDHEKENARWNKVSTLFLLIVGIKLLFLLMVLLTNPVIDTDAASTWRWVGLAKSLSSTGFLPTDFRWGSRLSPSFIPVWMSLFLSRWHDSLVVLPWWFTFVCFIVVVCRTAYRFTNNLDFSWFVGLLYVFVPLFSVHVIRPGFSDPIVSYLFTASACVMVLHLYCPRIRERADMVALAVLSIGIPLTKKEGILWFLWLWVVIGCFYLAERKILSWKRIWMGLGIGIVVAYALYFVSAEYLATYFEGARGFRLIFIKRYDFNAIKAFGDSLFAKGGFNLFWWTVVGGLLYLLFSRSKIETAYLSRYILLLLLAVAYFCCFTGNIIFTLNGTNVARFYLQLAGLGVPVFLLTYQNLMGEEEV